MLIKKSIAASLIKKVFSIYFIVTILITCIQLVNEYFHTKDNVREEIEKMETTFETGLAAAVWEYNMAQLDSIIYGMEEISTVLGVKITDDSGNEIKAIGTTLNEKKEQVFTDSEWNRVDLSSFTPSRGLFFYSFDIKYYGDSEDVVGKCFIYSGSEIVIERIKYSFILIIINSIIKTMALWFIIFYFTRKIIGKPLTILTESAEKMDPNNPEFFNISYSAEEKKLLRSEDELGILVQTFDKMRHAILERVENLEIIRRLGQVLSANRDISITFREIMKIMKEKFDFQKGVLFLSDDSSDERTLFKMIIGHPAEETRAENFCTGEGIIGKSAQDQVIIHNVSDNDSLGKESLYIPLLDGNCSSGMLNFFGTGGKFKLTSENRTFLQAMSRLTAINIKNIQILQLLEKTIQLEQEMEIAKQIQSVLLPGKPCIEGYDIAVSLEPADEVGGDYYDVISVGDYDWIIIGDVSGHGLTSGLVMMMVQTAIHTVLLENPEVPPSGLLSAINRAIYQNIEKMEESKHMTISVMAGGRNGNFTFAGLHEDIFVRRAETGKVDEIETEGMWIGLEPDISRLLSDDTLKLEPGDCMVLFTDGITEAMDNNGRLFGNKRLAGVIGESGNGSASAIHDSIIHALEPYEKPDDVTLVVVKRLE